jgi:hypothetical protein
MPVCSDSGCFAVGGSRTRRVADARDPGVVDQPTTARTTHRSLEDSNLQPRDLQGQFRSGWGEAQRPVQSVGESPFRRNVYTPGGIEPGRPKVTSRPSDS